MSRLRYLIRLLLGVIIGMTSIAVSARPKNNSTYDGQVDFGAQLLRVDGACLSVHGAMTAGRFFDDLRRVDKAGRLEYRKRGKLVTEYPESLTTSIRISRDACGGGYSKSPSPIFRGDSYSLKLLVYWKHDMQMRPAALAPDLARCVGYLIATAPDENLAVPSISCQMTVASKGVPLGDHLIVSILAADGRPITRIAAAP